jgi:NTP pyrophosphatase (non-canonical NTP hydrolase)
MNLDKLASDLHSTAVEKGFWNYEQDFVFFAKQLAMVHSEVTEVLEALRKEKGEQQVVEELADILIRVLDLYQGLKDAHVVSLSLHDILEEKANINKDRPKMHGVLG